MKYPRLLVASLPTKMALTQSSKCPKCAINIRNDNTTEVLYPFIHYFYPKAKLLTIYAPPHARTFPIIDKLFQHYNETAVYIASADLTHYGSNYGFTPPTDGLPPNKWAQDINDKAFVDSAINMNKEEVIRRSLSDQSSCSGGAVAAVVYAATLKGIAQGELVGYASSYDKHPSANFVGYAGLVY